MFYKVYFESDIHAELVAVVSEKLYDEILPSLKTEAKKARMKVTECMTSGGYDDMGEIKQALEWFPMG